MNPAYDRYRAQLPGGGELALEAMDKYELEDMGRRTYHFVRSVMRNPELRQVIRAMAEQIRAEEAAKAAQC
jgi:hypothetical protein